MLGKLHFKLTHAGESRPAVKGWTGASPSGDGTVAQVEQRIDHDDRVPSRLGKGLVPRYRKRVVLANGRVIKDYDGPIDEGHGHPRTWTRHNAWVRFARRRRL